LIVYLITEANFKSHHTFDLATWEDNPQEPSAPKKYRILRAMKVSQFAEQIAEEHELGEDQVRFWVMVNRQNKTTRPDQPLSDPNLTIEEAYNRYATKGNNCLRLWAEFSDQEAGKVEWPLARPQDNNNPILIFLKYFDLEAQTLTGVGHTYVKKHQKVADLASHVLEVMNWPAGTQFMLYEVSLQHCSRTSLIYPPGNQVLDDRVHETEANISAVRDPRRRYCMLPKDAA
jgi:ubiquitin carboxyl-terminal hydrolase 7